MANFSLIDFKIGLYIQVNVPTGQNKIEVHIYQFSQNGHQLKQKRPDATLAYGHLMSICQSGIWPILIQLMAILGKLVKLYPILTFFFLFLMLFF